MIARKLFEGAFPASVGSMMTVMGMTPGRRRPLPADPWEFCRRCVWTYDERAEERHVKPVRKLPDLAYLEALTREWAAGKNLWVDKPRQVLVTWLFAALYLWKVLARPGVRVPWFCLKKTLASKHVRERCYRIYTLIPAMWEKPYAKISDGELQVFHDGEFALPTSQITPMAAEVEGEDEAARQMRSQTWTDAYLDEGAFYRNTAELVFSLLPSCGRVVEVSTANGRSFHWRLGYCGSLDAPRPEPAQVTPTELMRGLQAWDNHGFRCLALDYWADPDKDPQTEKGRAWVEAEKLRVPSAQKWKREYERDHSVAANCPVYADTDRIVVKPQLYVPGFVVWRWWDFGFQNPVCIFAQVRRKGEEGGEKVHVLKVVDVGNMLVQAFATEHVLPTSAELFPRATWRDAGDPAGKQRSDTSALSAIKVLEALGVQVRTKAARVDSRVDVLQDIISSGRLEVDSDDAGCMWLLDDLRGGYYRDDDGVPVKDGVHDHRPDALGYGVWNVFEIAAPGDRGVHRPHVARGPAKGGR